MNTLTTYTAQYVTADGAPAAPQPFETAGREAFGVIATILLNERFGQFTYSTRITADDGTTVTYRVNAIDGTMLGEISVTREDAPASNADITCATCGAEWSLECVCETETDHDDDDEGDYTFVHIMLDDDTIAQLFETLIWQAGDGHDGTGPNLDSLGYGRDDIPRDDQERLIARFRTFIATNRRDIEAFTTHTGRNLAGVAHDYILTANRHGAGFWDRCYCGNDDAAQRLTDMAHLNGPIELMRHDDGSLTLY